MPRKTLPRLATDTSEWRRVGAAGYVRGVSHPHDSAPRRPLPATTLFSNALERARTGETVSLEPEEVAHARALRLSVGEPVLVTDGRGRRWEAEVTEAGRRSVSCRLCAPRPAPAPRRLTLWAPVGNKDRSLWLVEKAVELGVRRLVLTECARSRSVADAGRSAGFLDRARRRAIAALTQSGGADLPELTGPHDLDALLETLPPPDARTARLLADADGRPPSGVLCAGAPESAIWFVGPEGGLTTEERRAAVAAGFELVGLGARTLRFETAALAGLAIVAVALDAATGAAGREGPDAPPAGGPESATPPDGGRSEPRSGAT